MPDPLIPADPGLVPSILDTLRLGGFGVRNLLKGNIEGAGRNVVDIFGRTIDSVAPGDWIPDISRPEDRPEFRDVIDLGGDNIGTDLLNFAGDVATDPVTYIPGTQVAKGFQLAGKGAAKAGSLLPEAIRTPIVDTASQIGRKIRETTGNQIVSPATEAALRAKQAVSDLVSRSGQEGAAEALSGLSERELTALGEAGHNLRLDPLTGRPSALIDPTESLTFEQRLQKLAGEDPSLSPERLLAAYPKVRDTLRTQWEVGQEAATTPGGGVFFKEPMAGTPDVVMGGYKDIPSQGVADYFPRQFSGLKEDEIDLVTGLPKELPGFKPAVGGTPSPLRARADWNAQQILDYLTNNPKVNLEFNAAKALAKRAGTQGEAAGRAQIGQDLFNRAAAGSIPLTDDLVRSLMPKATELESKAVVGPSTAATEAEEAIPAGLQQLGLGGSSGKSAVGKTTAQETPGLVTDIERAKARDWLKSNDFKLADPEMKAAANAIAKQLPSEEATVVLNALNGLAPRGAFTGALAKLNTYFKPYAVYGAIIPKLGSITRNLTGGIAQQFANAEARGDTLGAAKRLIPNWLKSIDDGIERLTGKRIGKNEFKEIDEAFKSSGGDPRKVLGSIKYPIMREAVEKGVLGNTFVSTEQLIQDAAGGGWKAFGKKLMDYSGVMFKGAEQRMRYGLFKSLRAQGKSADEAAKIVQDAFYDYRISSAENRLARDLIPFYQFTAKAIPQQAKLLAEKPYLASALANLSGGSQGQPLPPHLEGRINIPVGSDEQGNQQFISNLGLPVESLNWLPNPSADLNQFGRQVEQNQIGSLNPLLKTAFAVTSGEDPFFATPYGSYTKVAGQDLGRPGAVLNQLLGTGLPGASALSGLLGMGSKVSDERTSLGEKAVNLLTGAKVTSVDPDVALRQKLQSYLESNPNVSQFRSFFQTGDDADTAALIQQLNDAKKAIKAKQKALIPAD